MGKSQISMSVANPYKQLVKSQIKCPNHKSFHPKSQVKS